MKYIEDFLLAAILLVCVVGLIMVSGILMAQDVYKRSDGYTAGCTNPTAREDGTPFDPTTELDSVEYYVGMTDGDLVNYQHRIIMMGGCQSVFIDTKQWPVGDYYRYGIAIDTDLVSSAVSPGNPFTLQNARPNPPGQVR